MVMSSGNRFRRVASVQDADESGNIIEGTDRYAESVASPIKEKPNTSRTRKDKSRRGSSPPLQGALTDSDSTAHPVSPVRESRTKSSREAKDKKSLSSNGSRKSASHKQALVAVRPAPKHVKTSPAMAYSRKADEAAYYGVQAAVTPASSRPRPQAAQQRPASYYGSTTSSHPPPSNVRFYAHQYPPPAGPPALYPPQHWAAAAPVVYSPAPPPTAMAPIPNEYYAHRPQNLIGRFGPARPQSAMGYRPTHQSDFDRDYVGERRVARRPSVSRRPTVDEDRRSMPPPPPRPSTARPTVAFRPPSTPAKRAVGFEDDDIAVGEPDLFQDISPINRYDRSRVRRPSIGATSISYDAGAYRTEIATTKTRRRNSYVAGQSLSSAGSYEDKLRQATAYQDNIVGSSLPLTVETLRKASKNGGSSRSTRSSGSHDESDYRRSATTRTTRSSTNEEDVTIRVKGNALLKVGGAEMQCQDGAEINISRGSGGGGEAVNVSGYRGSSDRSSYVDSDERYNRMRRLPIRTRSSSHATSYSRTLPRYEVPSSSQYDDYTYLSSIPPYPAYPTQQDSNFI
ncbi:hypothetical protein VTK73DRAFT_1594 [Phialemonium thermophilum]|uniref:Uncharacterized protein n=1 Tax=Phialemonium thermophilum TaxID=223376 RepID=A0ABR3Y496_9PEZI